MEETVYTLQSHGPTAKHMPHRASQLLVSYETVVVLLDATLTLETGPRILDGNEVES